MAAWSSESLPLFAINDSASMGMCDATTVHVIKETPLWRYVKHEVNTLAWACLIVVTFLLLRRLCGELRLLVLGYRLPGPPARALNGRSKCLYPTATSQGPQMLQDLLGRLHQEYGPVVKIWTGPAQLLVSIKDTELLQHMFEHAKDRVPSPRVALQLVYGHRSLFFSNFSKASQSRLRLEKEINGKFLREAHTTSVKVAEKLATQLAEPGKNNNGIWEVDCMTFSRLMAFGALGTSLYGDEYMTWPVAREFEKLMVQVTAELPTWMPYSVPPLWNANFNQFRKRCQRLRVLARQLVANGEQTRFQESEDIRVGDKNVLAEIAEAFVASLFSSMGMELGSVAEPCASGIMSHGSLNIAGVLCSVLAQLAHHAHIQTKVHDEIQTVCGSEKPPTEADMKKMVFLAATVHEAARLLPTAPFLQRCSVHQDIELQSGVIIPAGAILAAPVQLIQQEKLFWGEDANIFNPDRFLKANSNMSSEEPLASENLYKSNHDSQKGAEGQPISNIPANFLVFGAGFRSCIGSTFALKQISTLVAVILQQFELKEISDTSYAETKGQRRLTLSPRY